MMIPLVWNRRPRHGPSRRWTARYAARVFDALKPRSCRRAPLRWALPGFGACQYLFFALRVARGAPGELDRLAAARHAELGSSAATCARPCAASAQPLRHRLVAQALASSVSTSRSRRSGQRSTRVPRLARVASAHAERTQPARAMRAAAPPARTRRAPAPGAGRHDGVRSSPRTPSGPAAPATPGHARSGSPARPRPALGAPLAGSSTRRGRGRAAAKSAAAGDRCSQQASWPMRQRSPLRKHPARRAHDALDLVGRPRNQAASAQPRPAARTRGPRSGDACLRSAPSSSCVLAGCWPGAASSAATCRACWLPAVAGISAPAPPAAPGPRGAGPVALLDAAIGIADQQQLHIHVVVTCLA